MTYFMGSITGDLTRRLREFGQVRRGADRFAPPAVANCGLA
jgi:hypothetical protein